jgi:hypothetical protein
MEALAKRMKKMSTAQIVTMALTISVATFLIWILLAVIVWGFLHLIGFRFSLWEMLEAVSTAAAMAQVLGGGVVALVQLTESADSRNLSIYKDVFANMMSEQSMEARRWIYQELPADPRTGVNTLTPEGRAHIKHVLNSFDHLGFLMKQDWVTAEPVVDWVSPMVVKTWEKLGPYVDYEIQRRQEPDYYVSARDLARHCQERRQSHVPNAKIVWLDTAI